MADGSASNFMTSIGEWAHLLAGATNAGTPPLGGRNVKIAERRIWTAPLIVRPFLPLKGGLPMLGNRL
jgi:hypothetical protein